MGLGGDDGSVATGNAGYLQTTSFDHHPDDGDDDHDYYYGYHDHDDDQIMMISICIGRQRPWQYRSAIRNPLSISWTFNSADATIVMMITMLINIIKIKMKTENLTRTRICDDKDDKIVPTGSRAACCLVQKTVQVCRQIILN